MQTIGWLSSYFPILKALYPNPEDLRKASLSHLDFFNTHPWFVSAILGACAYESEHLHNENTQHELKNATMGPLGGIGDSIVWYLIFPLATLFSISVKTSLHSLLFFVISISSIRIGLRFGLIHWTYKKGRVALISLAHLLHTFHDQLKPIGIATLGALTYVTLTVLIQPSTHSESLLYGSIFIVFVLLIPNVKWTYEKWFIIILVSQFFLNLLMY